jgi:hypothetical protein
MSATPADKAQAETALTPARSLARWRSSIRAPRTRTSSTGGGLEARGRNPERTPLLQRRRARLTSVESFPGNLVAGLFDVKRRDFFEPAANRAQHVGFGT